MQANKNLIAETFTCPCCEMDKAVFDGNKFKCPECGHEWKNISKNKNEESNSGFSIENSDFEALINLEQPYFRLIKGKLYDCKVESSQGTEAASIIPLAFEKGKNRLFIMTEAMRLINENPAIVQEIIQMDFDHLWDDGIKNELPFDFEALTEICTTQKDESLRDVSGRRFFEFQESDQA